MSLFYMCDNLLDKKNYFLSSDHKKIMRQRKKMFLLRCLVNNELQRRFDTFHAVHSLSLDDYIRINYILGEPL